MAYKSKAERAAERAAASGMMWGELITHVRDVARCDEREARRQIGNAIEDRNERRPFWRPPGPMDFRAPDEPPRDAAYWLECKADPDDPDRIQERRYDPNRVDKRTAARLDRKARFRKPIFSREQVLALPGLEPSGSTAAYAPARRFLAALLKTNPRLTFKEALHACRKKCGQLSERGFRASVWPQAREAAGLPATGSPGRRPEPSR